MNSTITRTHESLRRYFRSAQHILPVAAVVDPQLVEYIREEQAYTPTSIENGVMVPTPFDLLPKDKQREALVVLFHTYE